MAMLEEDEFKALKDVVSYILDELGEMKHLEEILNSGPNTHRQREKIKRDHIATKAMKLRWFIVRMESGE